MTPAPRVLVTDAGRSSAIAIIRSLGRRGWHVVAADSNRRSPGFSSRYTAERLLHPSPADAPEEVVEVILDAANRRGIDLIVPVTDELVLPLSAARHRFKGVATLAMADADALAEVSDKTATLELAGALGVPVPSSALVSTVEEAMAQAAGLGWPLVLKPQASRVYAEGGAVASFEVAYAGSPAELATEMATFEGRCPVLLQEYCAGEGHGIELLLYEGRPLQAFQHRRLREVPITGGASSFRESVALDPVLYDHAARLLGSLDWTGLAMVEFKVGPAGARLMEVNGRIWGSLPLAVKAGMDFPRHMAELFLHGPPPEDVALDTSYTVGVRSRNLPLDVIWIGSALRRRRRFPFVAQPARREAVGVALSLLHPRGGFDVLVRDDIRPGLAEIAALAAKLRSKAARG
ncbi:MAG: ATP-grasp domain-containing protein [Actinomycetota bacterium]|nr:ATP-grasp domain-containing protein [Actinomycetota bacterium]